MPWLQLASRRPDELRGQVFKNSLAIREPSSITLFLALGAKFAPAPRLASRALRSRTVRAARYGSHSTRVVVWLCALTAQLDQRDSDGRRRALDHFRTVSTRCPCGRSRFLSRPSSAGQFERAQSNCPIELIGLICCCGRIAPIIARSIARVRLSASWKKPVRCRTPSSMSASIAT